MSSRMTPPSRRGDDLVRRGFPTRDVATITATVMPRRRRGRRTTTTTTTTASRNSPLFVTLAVFAASFLLAFESLHRAAAQPANNDAAEQYCEDATSALQFYQNQMLTWDSVYSTAFIALCFGLVCLLLYETLRRDPLIGKYIYDRKRLSQPDRSPPPLMTSRSLWRGGRDEGRRCPAGCWPVCPALFEILFMSLDPNYVRYSRRADEAKKMRETRGHHGCCGNGWINRSLLNNYRGRRSSSNVDEDGYEFYPDYKREYSHTFHGDDARYSVEHIEDPVKDDDDDGFGEFLMVVSGTLSSPKDRVNEDEEGEAKAATTTSAIRKTAFDLFPEEDLRQYFAQSRYNRGGVGGKRDLIKNIMDGGIELTESEHNKTASSERGSGVEDDTKDEENTPPLSRDADGRNLTVNTTGVIDGIDEDEVKYPSRLKYVFTLLPFYNWRSTFKKIGDFLLLPAFLQSCRYVLSKMRLSPRGSRRGDEFGRLDTSTGVLVTTPGKDLSTEDKELLRCAGLDMYLHIRFARFGFDATFYPFLVGLVFVLPVYNVMNQYHSIPAEIAPKYLGLTINNIRDGSKAMLWIVLLTICLYLYIMRRLWIEWEVFLKLRHEFLARGGVHFFKDVRPTYLRKCQNTCIVECVPKSHRSDKILRNVFESLFPGEIEHAEMLIDTSKLEGILQKRRALIEKYENIDAKYQYEGWLRKKRESGQEPARPMIKIGGIFSGKKQDALEYYNSKIIELDELASKEYDAIVETRMKCHTISQIKSSGHAEEQDFFHGTGVVTFNSIAGKQSAVQCNLSGQPYWMVTEDAPDPRDLLWSNVGVDLVIMGRKKKIVQAILLLGIICWSYFVDFIQNIINKKEEVESSLDEFDQSVQKGFLPVLLIVIILKIIPHIIHAIAKSVIRFKTRSQVDSFVMFWNTAYRLANIYVSIFAVSADQAFALFLECPEVFFRYLASTILGQAPYFMNLMLIATGMETMILLSQPRSLIKHLISRPFVNLNAKSRRYHEKLNTAHKMEEAFMFGFFAPVLSYGFMISMIFGFMVPILPGFCALYFWITAKISTHNALFVYCQRFERGGILFYYWNRVLFIILYSSIIIFSSIIAMKGFPKLGLGVFVTMMVLTYSVSKSIESRFVIHSHHLPISIARIHDEEEVALFGESQVQPDGGENFLYRHPILKHENWNSRDTWNFK